MIYFKITRDYINSYRVAVIPELERSFFEFVNPRGFQWDRIPEPGSINFTVRSIADLEKYFG